MQTSTKQTEAITSEQMALMAAAAPSRQVARALQRRAEKHNRKLLKQEEMVVRRHLVASRKANRPRVRPEPVSYPAGEDQRHDKYLHASARRGRALRTALSARQ